MDALTRTQVRRVDQLAIERLGIPGVVLMENASRQVAQTALGMLEDELHLMLEDSSVAVLCGGGNNGGDGFAAARHLSNHGVKVVVYLTKEPAGIAGDAAINLKIIQNMGLDIRMVLDDRQLAEAAQDWANVHLIIDALLGTGFTGQVHGITAAVITECNRVAGDEIKVLAVDVPSGLDCDTGVPSNAVILADVTVTFVAMKVGFLQATAEPFLGEVVVADIGAPTWLALQAVEESPA